MLRNQTRGEKNLSVADFVAPKGSKSTDYVALFALSAGVGLSSLSEEFKSKGDDYNAIMSKLLADRLTEAFAERVHQFVRCEMWGYAEGEKLSPEQIIRGEYRGLRMAFGYPATPDHQLKRKVFDILKVEQFTTLKLTENMMIQPAEALCGMMLSDGEWFSVGKIDTKQMLDYAKRMGVDVERIKELLPNNCI